VIRGFFYDGRLEGETSLSILVEGFSAEVWGSRIKFLRLGFPTFSGRLTIDLELVRTRRIREKVMSPRAELDWKALYRSRSA